jgi:hypothetical protein
MFIKKSMLFHALIISLFLMFLKSFQRCPYYYKVSAVGYDGEEGDISQSCSASITRVSNDITSFKFMDFDASGDINAVINGTNINVTVPSIVNLTALVPTISHNGASIAPASGTAQNFSNPLRYTVTAENGNSKEYVVTAAVANDSLASAFAWLGNNAKNNRNYTMVPKRDEALGPVSLSYGNKTVALTIKGESSERVISLSGNGSIFTVGSNVALTLDNNITLKGKNSNTNPLVKVDGSNAGLVMNAGSKITGNYTSLNGGGVYVGRGYFNMNGGTISDNRVYTGEGSTGKGGGVYIARGADFTMYNGNINNNAVSDGGYAYGGGVYVEGAFTMHNGNINGNSASSKDTINISVEPASRGGGVCVYGSYASFIMEGGSISNNSASADAGFFGSSYAYGGGVYVDSGTFRKTGGSVSLNTLSASIKTGKTAYVSIGSTALKREADAGTFTGLDSTKTGGGWE